MTDCHERSQDCSITHALTLTSWDQVKNPESSFAKHPHLRTFARRPPERMPSVLNVHTGTPTCTSLHRGPAPQLCAEVRSMRPLNTCLRFSAVCSFQHPATGLCGATSCCRQPQNTKTKPCRAALKTSASHPTDLRFKASLRLTAPTASPSVPLLCHSSLTRTHEVRRSKTACLSCQQTRPPPPPTPTLKRFNGLQVPANDGQ